MATLLCESTDIGEVARVEAMQAPGTYEARLSLAAPISQEELTAFHESLLDSGVDVRGLIQERVRGLWQVVVKYRIHALPESVAVWPLLIPMIPTVIVGVLVGIALFKIKDIAMLVLVVGGVVIVGGLVYRSIKATAPGR